MIRKLFIATALCAAAPLVMAADCSIELESDDAMTYNMDNIDVPGGCTDFTINLKHIGSLPVAAMGHNVVITATADLSAVASDSIKAGASAGYIPADDARIIAHSDMIGGGESTSVTFPVASISEGGPYSFFCSFPGHSALMKGTLTLQ